MNVGTRTIPGRLLALATPWTTPLDPAALLGTLHMGSRRTSAPLTEQSPPSSETSVRTSTPTIRWGTDAEVEASEDDLILDALEGAGLEPTFGCRRGVCRRCVVRLDEGRVRDRRDERDVDAGTHVRICVSSPLADIHLDPGAAAASSTPSPRRLANTGAHS